MMTKTSQPGAEPANVFQDRVTPDQWRVEWFDDDGRCELEIFTGHDARRQAPLRYAMRRSATPCGSTGISEKYRERSRARYRACPLAKSWQNPPRSAPSPVLFRQHYARFVWVQWRQVVGFRLRIETR
jgi:hypothetical protein